MIDCHDGDDDDDDEDYADDDDDDVDNGDVLFYQKLKTKDDD